MRYRYRTTFVCRRCGVPVKLASGDTWRHICNPRVRSQRRSCGLPPLPICGSQMWEQGDRAARAGKHLHDNPYPQTEWAAAEWTRGFMGQ